MTLIPSQIKCEHRHLCGVSELIAEIELEQWEEDVLKKYIYVNVSSVGEESYVVAQNSYFGYLEEDDAEYYILENYESLKEAKKSKYFKYFQYCKKLLNDFESL